MNARRRIRICSVAVAVVTMAVLAPHPASAQGPRVRTALDSTLVSVGDRLQLTVTVEHAPGDRVVWPDSLSLYPFEILGADVLAPADVEDRVITGARLTLTIFELGDLEIPSFDLLVESPDGASTTVSTDAYGVSVQSVGLDEGGDIRAIRGPLGIPIGVIYVLPWLLLLLAIGLAAFWLWRRWCGGVGDGPRRSVIIPRLPHEEAYEALDRLEASSLLEQMEIKQYHISVSEIIRSYVEGRFDIFALELTTYEVMEGLHESGLDDDELAAFDTFLSRCDLVKFAKLRPTPHTCRQVLATARELVDRTRPRVADFASGPMRNGDDGPMQGGDEDDVQDEDGTQDENGGGSPSDCDDPTRPGESLLEPAGVEEA